MWIPRHSVCKMVYSHLGMFYVVIVMMCCQTLLHLTMTSTAVFVAIGPQIVLLSLVHVNALYQEW